MIPHFNLQCGITQPILRLLCRYGALAGFGLSLTKWTLIIKKSSDFAVNAAFNDVDFRGGNHHRQAKIPTLMFGD